jgi:hypothetical protein
VIGKTWAKETNMDVFAFVLGMLGSISFCIAAFFHLHDVLAFLLIIFGLLFLYVAAVFHLCLFHKGMKEQQKAQQHGHSLRPGLRFRTVWNGKFGILFAIMALVITAGIELEGPLKSLPLVVVNLIMQPFCLYCIALGSYAVGQALLGRFTYAFRVIPPETIPANRYRMLLKYRTFSGIVGILFGCGLSYLCLMPLL